MAKCEDCICFKSCQAWCVAVDKALKTVAITEELQKNNAELCPSFKNKADVVEVVRCKDCIYNFKSDTEGYFVCSAMTNLNYVPLNHFCSYGERKEE